MVSRHFAYTTLLTGVVEGACYIYADNLIVLLFRAAGPGRPLLGGALSLSRWLLQLLFFLLLGWQGASLLLTPPAPPPPPAPRAQRHGGGGGGGSAPAPCGGAATPAAAPAAAAAAARVRAERASLKALMRHPHVALAPFVHVFTAPFERVAAALDSPAVPAGVEATAGATTTATVRDVLAKSRTDRIMMPIPPAIASGAGLPATAEITDEVLQLPDAKFLRVVRRNANLRDMGELVATHVYEPDPQNPAFTRLTATFSLMVHSFATRLVAKAALGALDGRAVLKDHLAVLQSRLVVG